MSKDKFWDNYMKKCADAAKEYLAKHPRNGKYKISCRAYDEDLQQYLEPVSVSIELTDEEYVKILAEMLSVRYNVTFNFLLLHLPDIAKKIHDQALDAMEQHEAQDLCPFMILLDEFSHDRWQMPEVLDDLF